MSDELKAGPELDAEVARRLFGYNGEAWISQSSAGEKKTRGVLNARIVDIPPYSTDISAAWQVVERLIEQGASPALIYDDFGHWALVLDGYQQIPDDGEGPDSIQVAWFIEKDDWADTAPLAICRAVLRDADGDQPAPAAASEGSET